MAHIIGDTRLFVANARHGSRYVPSLVIGKINWFSAVLKKIGRVSMLKMKVSRKNVMDVRTDLFNEPELPWKIFLPKIEAIDLDDVPSFIWDIPYTIPELSYLTHKHFRYYGKFPSVVAGQLLEQFPPPTSKSYVLDNFCGSGTTLVEAKLRQIQSVGVDVSWLGALASNVKTKAIDLEAAKRLLVELQAIFAKLGTPELPSVRIVEKWFDRETALDLMRLQSCLLDLPSGDLRNFATVAFLAIIRRVSRAHDAEVRPHIKKDKRSRDVLSAFSKKYSEMLGRHRNFMEVTSASTSSECFIGDNRDLSRFNDSGCYLVISHPPYLNSFDYKPVFGMEYYWGAPFGEAIFPNPTGFLKGEMKAWPANDKITTGYYEHLVDCYKETYRIQPKGGLLAVVIGDCTRHKVLEPVVKKTEALIEAIGYKLVQRNFRTTHYGLGKYAYDFRADYHGDDAQKKDAILVFRK